MSTGPYSSYKGGPASSGQGTTAPVPSSALFEQLDMLYRDGLAFGLYEDFTNFRAGTPAATLLQEWAPGWRVVGVATNGIFGLVDSVGGGLTLSTEAAAHDHLSAEKVTKPFQIGAASPLFAFEACFKVASIADTKSDFFVGLGDVMTISATVPITATAGTLASEKLFGFHRNATDGDEVDLVTADATTPTILKNGIATLVADTYITVGLYLNTQREANIIPSINGIFKEANKVACTATNVPDDARLGVIFAQVAAAASAGLTTLKWVKCMQAHAGVRMH